MYAYCGNNPVMYVDPTGEFGWHVVVGATLGFAFEVASQLIANGGDFSNLNWLKVDIATVVGGITTLTGAGVGALISGVGNTFMELAGGTNNMQKLGLAFAVGVGASLIGSGIGKVAEKIGGKIAIKSLAKKTPGQIKHIVNKTIKVASKDRNMVKDLAWTLAQNSYKNLPKALIGKTIPQIFNSIGVGISGYGTMGGIYGFN